MKAKFLGKFKTIALKKDKIYDVIAVENGWLRIFTDVDEDYLFPPEKFEIIRSENDMREANYRYRIERVSSSDCWIFIDCEGEDSLNDPSSFICLLKFIAATLNAGEWKEKICSTGGNMGYTVKNDPLNLVYQWDDLYGIVVDYTNAPGLDDTKAFLLENFQIK